MEPRSKSQVRRLAHQRRARDERLHAAVVRLRERFGARAFTSGMAAEEVEGPAGAKEAVATVERLKARGSLVRAGRRTWRVRE